MNQTPTAAGLTLVLGASPNSWRYSNRAVEKLKAHGQKVIAVGKHPGTIGETRITTELPTGTGVDTVSLYLRAENQKDYYDYILDLKPARIIFNPGAENEELFRMALERGIRPVNACTLVLLATGQY